MTVFLGIFLWAILAFADTFVSERSVPVYAQPSSSAKFLGNLKAGREVEIEKRGKLWIKIQLKGGKFGYIPAGHEDLEDFGSSEDYFFKGGRLGVGYSLSMYTQSSRTFTDTDNTQTDISNLEGTSSYLGFLLEWPSSPRLMYRFGLAMRSLAMTGTARYRSIVATANTPVEIQQEFFSVIGGARYALWKHIWLGGFLEFASGTKSKVLGTATEKPSYFFVQPALGTDFKVYKSIWILPEIRLGVIVNSKPFLLNPEFALNTGWEF